MPRLIQPETRTETLVDAINYVLARDGVTGLSLRAIAQASGVTTSSMFHHYESRERLLLMAAKMTGDARVQAFARRAHLEGVCAFLPAPGDDEDLITARAWLGWLELWRSDDALTQTMARIRDDELLLLADTLDVRPDIQDLTTVTAMIDGLTVAVCSPRRPLPPQRARDLLRTYVAADPALSLPSEV